MTAPCAKRSIIYFLNIRIAHELKGGGGGERILQGRERQLWYGTSAAYHTPCDITFTISYDISYHICLPNWPFWPKSVLSNLVRIPCEMKPSLPCKEILSTFVVKRSILVSVEAFKGYKIPLCPTPSCVQICSNIELGNGRLLSFAISGFRGGGG